MNSVTATSQIGEIKAALRRASAATGTDFDYLLRTAKRESALKPEAKAETSSATGLFQFIEQTWLAVVKASGDQFGLGKYADAITRTSDGRHKVTDPQMRREILALRKDPDTASLMAGVYTRDAANRLSDAFGRAPLEGELYIAHFFGSGGAVRLIKAAQATPDASAVDMFPRAARANRPLFYDRNGDHRSVQDVYTRLVGSHGRNKSSFGDIQTAATTRPNRPAQSVDAARVEPASSNFRLASHFQDVSAASQRLAGNRPLQSLFSTPVAEAPSAIRPASSDRVSRDGPMMIIPGAVQVAVQAAPDPAKPGAIPTRRDGGPLNIVPRSPAGFLEKHAPLLSLFRTPEIT